MTHGGWNHVLARCGGVALAELALDKPLWDWGLTPGAECPTMGIP